MLSQAPPNDLILLIPRTTAVQSALQHLTRLDNVDTILLDSVVYYFTTQYNLPTEFQHSNQKNRGEQLTTIDNTTNELFIVDLFFCVHNFASGNGVLPRWNVKYGNESLCNFIIFRKTLWSCSDNCWKLYRIVIFDSTLFSWFLERYNSQWAHSIWFEMFLRFDLFTQSASTLLFSIEMFTLKMLPDFGAMI